MVIVVAVVVTIPGKWDIGNGEDLCRYWSPVTDSKVKKQNIPLAGHNSPPTVLVVFIVVVVVVAVPGI